MLVLLFVPMVVWVLCVGGVCSRGLFAHVRVWSVHMHTWLGFGLGVVSVFDPAASTTPGRPH